MSNYTKSTNFASKDALASGNPLKIVKGTEIDTEFNNIATAIATKADLASPTFTGSPVLPTGTTGITQTAGTNNTTLATTAFVQAAISAAQAFPSGTAMLFVQTSAPTGWTKSTTHNDKTLRVVSGSASSGGSSAFSTVFANQTPTISNTFSIASTTLTTSQIPSHTHNVGGSAAGSAFCGGFPFAGNSSLAVSSATGGGGSHTHTLSGSATSSAITLNVQYVDVIIATKD